jgi:hypothetical protein
MRFVAISPAPRPRGALLRTNLVKMGDRHERQMLMTTLVDRPNSALIVIYLQNGVVANAFRREMVLEAVKSLVARGRTARVPVCGSVNATRTWRRVAKRGRLLANSRRYPRKWSLKSITGTRSKAPTSNRVIEARGRQSYRDRRANGHVHPLDAAWRARARV